MKKILARLAVTFLAMSGSLTVAVSPAQAATCVHDYVPNWVNFYRDINYCGPRLSYGGNLNQCYNIPSNEDDWASSFSNDNPYRLMLYVHINCDGNGNWYRAAAYTGHHDLRQVGMNDAISSFKWII